MMQWENIHEYYYAWAAYLIGATGCCVATWWLFFSLPRILKHVLVVTVIVLLFTPFLIDSSDMIFAPAIVCLGYGWIAEGFGYIRPVLKTLLGGWILALILLLAYQILIRHRMQSTSLQDTEFVRREDSEGFIEPVLDSPKRSSDVIRAER